MKKPGIIILFIILSSYGLIAQNQQNQTAWVDSVYNTLSLRQKISQLLMVRAYSNKGEDHQKMISNLIEEYHIGGLCFFQGGPDRQKNLTQLYQSQSQVPLLIAMDAEWGLGMRLDSSYSFPFQITLGAIENDSIIYQMGTEVANQLKSIGVHINFAPVADINNNPLNPVINSRSFGENKKLVAAKSIEYMKGLQDNGIIATAKHFPGHGDTDSDSHKTLPIINHDYLRIDSVELYPFKEMIAAGIKGIMIAHLFIPALDDTENLPTTLSKKVVTNLLVDSLGFEGLKITDALDMQGVTKFYKPGEIELNALLAGNDILLLPQNVEAAITRIESNVENGIVPLQLIEDKCKKILRTKFEVVLPTLKDSLFNEHQTIVNNNNDKVITRRIFKDAVTILGNETDILPIKSMEENKIAILSIGSSQINAFQKTLAKYCPITYFNTEKNIPESQVGILKKELAAFDLVILSVHNTNIFPNKNFGITSSSIHLVNQISSKTPTILTLFASPYALKYFNRNQFHSIVVGYEDKVEAQEIAAQIIMGAIGSRGKLPVTINENYQFGEGVQTSALGRLEYSIPEDVGIHTEDLQKIDSIIYKNIDESAIPGCQIIVGKAGKVIYDKSYGYHTYKKGNFVRPYDIYDLASLTKIAATTLSVMKLSDENKIDIDERLVTYLPFSKGSNKEKIILREMMAHQSRLQAWIPFYLNTLDEKGELKNEFYSNKIKEGFTVPVCKNLYIKDDYHFTISDSIISSKLRKKKDYKYSDLGFYLLKQIIENITNQPFEKYVSKTFYSPLGMQTMRFNPLNTISKDQIVPTENDPIFRKQLIHGYVHDPGAAMLGGVAGHAGLFSNANDLAILLQMFLQKGYYGGVQYIKEETIEEFTKQQFPLNDNRRGIGFDKPIPDDKETVPGCKYVSDASYGHSGFTGTYFWCDPEYDLFYIFLSNRIHPTAENRKLIDNNTRSEVLEIIYKSFIKEAPAKGSL